MPNRTDPLTGTPAALVALAARRTDREAGLVRLAALLEEHGIADNVSLPNMKESR